MKTYLVGGAVRDKLLGFDIKDKDYVVVGCTPEQMTQRGFKPIGKDFPVFLHPKSKDEYALARTERKTSKGYHGFEFNTDISVTLEQDLQRRDLTINAMACNIENPEEIIDPYNGLDDIKNKYLRHVSDSFAEDPVRILRVARFAARYAHLGFKVHPSTIELMSKLVENKEVESLVSERVWQELRGAINCQTPSEFVKVLRKCGALKVLFPEIDCLFGVPQTKQWHPEVDTGVHVMMAMDKAYNLDNDIAFAVFTHDLGKGITPNHILPSHYGHEAGGIPLVKNMCDRLKVPSHYKKLALIVCRWHLHSHTAYELKATSIDKLFQKTSAYQQPSLFEKFLQACQADATGRLGKEFQSYPQADFLRNCFKATQTLNISSLIEKGYEGKKLGDAIRQARIELIKQVKNSCIKI
jgi:tRNA nucleotidyltransferase (CCA-adding enzyme)